MSILKLIKLNYLTFKIVSYFFSSGLKSNAFLKYVIASSLLPKLNLIHPARFTPSKLNG